LGQALVWWLAFLLLGLVALPVTTVLFRRLPDRGYGFSRALGLLLFSYAFWLLGVARVLPNSRAGAWGALLIVAALSACVLWRRRDAVLGFLRRRWGVVLATEAVFAAVFAVWGVLRSYSPEIAHTEQPMDFALLNGILASPHFPPNDPWFAGEPITYYYFGYLMNAGVAQLTGVAPAFAYNLALASTAAMAATGVFGLAYNVVATMRGRAGARPSPRTALLFGGAAVVLLLFIGNLVGALEYLNANDAGSDGFWSWVSIDGLTGHDGSSTWYPSDNGWWWWRSTRVINTFQDGQSLDYTITEFPFFSFMLGDLHPHVMSLPFVAMAMGLALNVLRTPGVWGLRVLRSGVAESARWGWPRRLARRWDVLVAALALGALGFLNSWDLPTFTALLFAALLLRAVHLRARGRQVRLRELAAFMAIFVAAEALLSAPFYLLFDSQAGGILTIRTAQTRQVHYLLVLGPLLVLNVALLAGLAWESLDLSGRVRRLALRLAGAGTPHEGRDAATGNPGPRPARWLGSPGLWAIVLPMAPFAVWAAIELGLSAREHDPAKGLLAIGSRFWHLLPILLLLSAGLAVLFRRAAREGRASASAQFAVLLVLFALLVTMGAELFRIADLFNNRMNTVFKFYYQAWAMLAVGGAVGLAYWTLRGETLARGARAAWWCLMALFVAVIGAAFLYVPAAAYAKAERFAPSPTLNALAAYEAAAPAEFEAVRWLREHARKGDVVLEGVPMSNGRPQGDYNPAVARISRNTGLPTVLGWAGHEHQWRGDPFEPIVQRARDVEAIYQTGSIDEARRLLKAYDVTYVVVGGLERRAYGPGAGQRFAPFMDIAFDIALGGDRVVLYRARAGG